MTYTRKAPRVPKTVTFNVSWIEEDITIISGSEIPFLALSKSITGDYRDILDLLPVDLVEILGTADGEEFHEFIQTWVRVSKEEADQEKKVDSLFSDIMGKEGFNFG